MILKCLLACCATTFLALSATAGVLVPKDSSWKYFKGVSEAASPDPTGWRSLDFNDSAWPTGNAAFYYENDPGSANAFTGQTLLSDMFGGYTSIFLRKTFQITNIHDFSSLQVAGFSDDGFIAWINGIEAGRFNMPLGEIAYNGTAGSAFPEPLSWWTNFLQQAQIYLKPGTNVFCVQAFNVNRSSSSDFIINPALYFTTDTTSPQLTMRFPDAGTVVRQLTSIEVAFSEPVQGVDAADLRINGQPATGLTIVTPSQFVFTFPQPATGPVQITWTAAHNIRDLTTAGNPFTASSWSVVLNPNAPLADVVISEFLAANSGNLANSIKDELGNSPDWIELFNRSSSPVSLTDWALTDSPSRLRKWVFPATVLPAGGYLLVMASGRDTNVAGQLHTNFRLSASGSFLALVDPATNVVSSFSPAYPAQYTDVSYGRDQLDSTLLGYFTNATPRTANSVRGAGFGPEVKFSRAGGTFVSAFALELSVPEANWDIRYLLVTNNVPSGTEAITNIPTLNSPLYTGPVPISGPVQVRARAFPKTVGYWPGPPRTECYLPITTLAAQFTSALPIFLVHNLGAGAIPQSTDQNVIFMAFEPIDGVASLTNPPTLVTRAGLNIRGSSTAGLPQSSYALELWDEYNQDRQESLLGMPEESDWVLFGQNGFDPSLLHNPLMHQLSRDIGRYSPRTRFAEMFVNTSGGMVTYGVPVAGHYFGLYTVLEKVKRSSSRLDIAKLEPQQSNAPDVTGGYLMKIDRADPDERTFWDSYIGREIIYQDPPGLEMASSARQAQRNYITGYFNQLGSALASTGYTNSITGYSAYVDVDSWLDHHLLNILAFNVDAIRLSGFFFKDREKKLEMGPLWDFDRSLGTHHPAVGYDDARCFNPKLWRVQAGGDQGTDFFGSANEPGLAVRWWGRMFNDPDFWQGWIDRWTELRRGPFSTNHIYSIIDTQRSQIRAAQVRQQSRWGHSQPRSGVISANGYVGKFSGTYDGEIAFLKTWLNDRLNFIDANFLRAPHLTFPGGTVIPGQTITITPATTPPGSRVYYTLDGTDPRLPGGAISAAALSSVGPVTISFTQNTRIFARSWNSNHSNMTNAPGAIGGNPPISSPWSGPSAGTYVIATPALAITEIMYHPADPGSGTNSSTDFEFIELKNVGTNDLNLVGTRFTEGIAFTFAPTNAITSLKPGAYCVLVKNFIAFKTRYPQVTNIAGVYLGSLDNSGEQITLQGSMGETILDFYFGDDAYPTTDGLGFSLVIRNESGPFSGWGVMQNWRQSSGLHGSPGTADPAPADIAPLVINEVNPHTDLPAVDTVEIYNPTADEVSLEGWFLTDDSAQPLKYVFPKGSKVAGGGFLLVNETSFGAGPLSFGLSSLGDEIYLFSGDGTNITGYRHGYEFGAQANGASFGRHITSDGRPHFATQVQPTLGAANSGPRVGPIVINEIHYAPKPLGLNANRLEEFIEIRNASPATVSLFDPLHPTNSWQFLDGVQFQLPQAVTLAPWSCALVVPFDPTYDPVSLQWFRSRFGVPAATPIFGPFEGSLANEGESLGLYYPDNPQLAPAPDAGFVPYILMERVAFSPSVPWPIAALESGKSLHRISGSTFGDEPANWLAGIPTPGWSPLSDADQDGLPDEWEVAFGLDPQNSGGADGSAGDPDEDGMRNSAELIAGTKPNDPNDRLALEIPQVFGTSCILQFRTQTNRVYVIESTTAFAAPMTWTAVTSVIQGSGSQIQISDPIVDGAVPKFYRIRVQLAGQ